MAEAKAFADRVGYPVLIKATAGGGGKGMREVHDPDQLESLTDALEAVGYNIIRTETGGWLVHEA